jgi:ABC-type glutathione transport system ATPase component
MGVVNKDYDAAPVASTVVERMQARGMFKPDALRVVYQSGAVSAHRLRRRAQPHPELKAKIKEAFLTFDFRTRSSARNSRTRKSSAPSSTSSTEGRAGDPEGVRHHLHPGESQQAPDEGRVVAALLAVEGLAKTYPGGQRALDGLSFTVERPEVIAVIGSSGAGKSTLIRCINRLVEPTAGRVLLSGAEVVGASRTELRRLRRRIG